MTERIEQNGIWKTGFEVIEKVITVPAYSYHVTAKEIHVGGYSYYRKAKKILVGAYDYFRPERTIHVEEYTYIKKITREVEKFFPYLFRYTLHIKVDYLHSKGKRGARPLAIEAQITSTLHKLDETEQEELKTSLKQKLVNALIDNYGSEVSDLLEVTGWEEEETESTIPILYGEITQSRKGFKYFKPQLYKKPYWLI